MLAECGVDRVGSLNETPNEEIQGKVDKLLQQFNEKANHAYTKLTVISWKSSIGWGTTYYVKIKTNEDSIAHLQFHKDYTENLDLQGIQKDKKLDDEIVRFEELKHL